MSRPQHPKRGEARELYIKSGGTLTPGQIEKRLGISPGLVRNWKTAEKWDDKVKKKRGGQPGNKNAVGAGAPFGNANAETHGAYSTVHFSSLPEDVQAYINQITDPLDAMVDQFRVLKAKEYALQNKINQLESGEADDLFVDKVIEMLVPRSPSSDDEDDPTPPAPSPDEAERLKTAMRTVIKASPFDRVRKLEAELNKTQGRILKLVDSMRTYELELRRADLEERKHRFNKQKATGQYEIDPETGEIDDETDQNDDDSDELLE